MLDLLKQPWAWYVAGPLIGLTVPLLLIIGNKPFGLSSSMKHICAACLPAKIPFFQYDWKKEIWNLFFVGGVFLGGVLAVELIGNPNSIAVSLELKAELATYGITNYDSLLPTEIMNWTSLFTLKGFTFMVFGGFLVGFGTRYANGCTSGHAIMGLSQLNIPSLIATCCFMASGVIMANFILPFLLKL